MDINFSQGPAVIFSCGGIQVEKANLFRFRPGGFAVLSNCGLPSGWVVAVWVPRAGGFFYNRASESSLKGWSDNGPGLQQECEQWPDCLLEGRGEGEGRGRNGRENGEGTREQNTSRNKESGPGTRGAHMSGFFVVCVLIGIRYGVSGNRRCCTDIGPVVLQQGQDFVGLLSRFPRSPNQR